MYQSILDKQVKYDEVVQDLLNDMSSIHRFVRVASAEYSGKFDLVEGAIREMLYLVEDASKFILSYDANRTRGELILV